MDNARAAKPGIFKSDIASSYRWFAYLAYLLFWFGLPFIDFSSSFDHFNTSKWLFLEVVVLTGVLVNFRCSEFRDYFGQRLFYFLAPLAILIVTHGMFTQSSWYGELRFSVLVCGLFLLARRKLKPEMFIRPEFAWLNLLIGFVFLVFHFFIKSSGQKPVDLVFGNESEYSEFIVGFLALESFRKITVSRSLYPGLSWFGGMSVLLNLKNRTAFLSIFLLLLGFFKTKKKFFAVGIAIFILFGTLALGAFVPSKSKSTEIRVVRIVNTLGMFLDNPMGIGFGEFERVYPKYSSYWRQDEEISPSSGVLSPHNVILEFLVEGGIPLLVILFLFIGLNIKLSIVGKIPPLSLVLIVAFIPQFFFSFPFENAVTSFFIVFAFSQIPFRFPARLARLKKLITKSILFKYVPVSGRIVFVLSCGASVFVSMNSHFPLGLNSEKVAIQIAPENSVLRIRLARKIAEDSGVEQALGILLEAEKKRVDTIPIWLEIHRYASYLDDENLKCRVQRKFLESKVFSELDPTTCFQN